MTNKPRKSSDIEALDYLIDNLELGKSIDFNGKIIKFDNQIALSNFKMGLAIGVALGGKDANISEVRDD